MKVWVVVLLCCVCVCVRVRVVWCVQGNAGSLEKALRMVRLNSVQLKQCPGHGAWDERHVVRGLQDGGLGGQRGLGRVLVREPDEPREAGSRW